MLRGKLLEVKSDVFVNASDVGTIVCDGGDLRNYLRKRVISINENASILPNNILEINDETGAILRYKLTNELDKIVPKFNRVLNYRLVDKRAKFHTDDTLDNVINTLNNENIVYEIRTNSITEIRKDEDTVFRLSRDGDNLAGQLLYEGSHYVVNLR